MSTSRYPSWQDFSLRPPDFAVPRRNFVRRSITVLLAGLALLVSAAPAHALTRVPFVGPARTYQLDGVCSFPILAEERAGHPGYLTLDGSGQVVQVQYGGSYDTVLSSSHGSLTFTTIGTTVVTANPDGTWTMVQKGTGLAVVPRDDPEGPKLVWFTGRVTSVGSFDPKTLEFIPLSQTRSGIDSNICEMLVTGLKSRHDAL
jgi:hypothetical protein